MISENPFVKFREECENALAHALKKAFPKIEVKDLALTKPPNVDFGELASSLCFEHAKRLKQKPIDLAEQLVSSIPKSGFSLIAKVVAAGGGYVNFFADFAKHAHFRYS